jgi:hypothetical protein
MSTASQLNCKLLLDCFCDQMRQLLLMRCASELCDSLNPIHIEFLNLECELSILLFVNDFTREILLQCVDVLSDSIGVLLSVAICFKPEVVGLAENDEVFWGVADLVVRRILCLVLDLVGQRKQESLLILLVTPH